MVDAVKPEDIKLPLRRVISGGQTGVDRAALDAAREAGLEYGGWCPKGRKCEAIDGSRTGIVPPEYPLVETQSSGYTERTSLNIKSADMTIIIDRVPPHRYTSGTALTYRLAKKYTNVLCINLNEVSDDDIHEIRADLIQLNVSVLNVAGPRASKAPKIYEEAKLVLSAVFTGKMPAEDE